MAIWFALGHDGNIYNLCDCGDIEAAEESANDVIPDMEGQVTNTKALWLFDEHTAHEWLNVLMAGISMNSKLRISDVEVPSGSSDNQNADFVLYFTVNDHLDVCVKRTDEGYVVDGFHPGMEGAFEPAVMTTWVHDNDLIREEDSE